MLAAVGITTMNRPRFADKCVRAAEASLRPLEAPLSLYNDGSDPRYRGEYQRAYKRAPEMVVIESNENRGVAHAKNRLLEHMLNETDAEWLFLLEDDIILTSPMAVIGYVEAAEVYGLHHLSFAHHGPANESGPMAVEGAIEFYPHSIGAWTMFSRECLEAVGLFDENFHNAWEHVEHEMRLIAAGFMPGAGPHCFPDVKDSALWLSELPTAITESAIRPRGDWQSSIVNGLRYWRDSKPETFEMLFGAGTPLEGYAASLLAQ
jgi:GT2 family glycosyltransferase